MLRKILSNKIVLVFTIIILVAGIVLCFVLGQEPEDNQKDTLQVEQDDNEDKEHEKDGSEEAGLEIKEEVDEDVDSIDGSGSWDPVPDSSDKKEQNDNTTSNSKEDTEQDKSDVEKEDEILDGDILEDDKEWSPIS